MLRGYEPAHIVGISKTAYVPATPRCLRLEAMTHRILVAGLLVVIVAIAAALGYQSLASSSSTAASPIDVLRSEPRS